MNTRTNSLRLVFACLAETHPLGIRTCFRVSRRNSMRFCPHRPIAGAGELPRTTNRKCPRKKRKERKKKRGGGEKIKSDVLQQPCTTPNKSCSFELNNSQCSYQISQRTLPPQKKYPTSAVSCRCSIFETLQRGTGIYVIGWIQLLRGVEIGLLLEGEGRGVKEAERTQQAGICDVPLRCSM